MTSPLFDGWPEAERTIVIPVTVDLLVTQFVHRWGYNATAQERMEQELRELLNAATRYPHHAG